MYKVAALLYPNAFATSVTLPMEIFRAATQIARVKNRSSTPIESMLTAPDQAGVHLFGSINLVPDITLPDLPPLDVLIIPAIWRNPLPTVAAARPWLHRLVEIAHSGTRVCAVGTGVCLLAEAGLLDNRPATTHWNYFDSFKARYPRVKLKTRHLITQSDNLYCAGSVNSIADLVVHIVENWYGNATARAVENQFSPEIRRPFAAAAYQTEVESTHHDELIIEAQHWLTQRLSEKVAISDLASELGVSHRTLDRRFQSATGQSPRTWLRRRRISQAKDLLRHSNLPVTEVAWQVGLQDASHFGRMFREQVGMTPAGYREAVRGKLFTPRPP